MCEDLSFFARFVAALGTGSPDWLLASREVKVNDAEGHGWFLAESLTPGIRVGQFEWEGRSARDELLGGMEDSIWIGLLLMGRCAVASPGSKEGLQRLQIGRCGVLRGKFAQVRTAPGIRLEGYVFRLEMEQLGRFPGLRDRIDEQGRASLDELILPGGKLSARLESLSRALQCAARSTVAERLQRGALLLAWLAEFFAPLAAEKAEHFRDQDEASRIWEITRYLDARLTEEHSLRGLSQRFGMNEFLLKKRFKEITGTTVFAYLRDSRLHRAEKLLRESSASILEIANQVGFSNPSHFARAFRARFGTLPKGYRLRVAARFEGDIA
jgi:AraC-like DNA-binding protein